jgi:ribosomal protein L37AE/L43A
MKRRKEMELKRVVCPNCGAQIHAKEGRKFMYCEYCGTQIALDDGTQRYEYEFIDRALVKEAENESKRIDEHIRDKELYL